MQRKVHSSSCTTARVLASAALFATPFATLFATLFAGAATAQTAITAEDPPTMESAQAAYERNHWDQAHAAFTLLAEQGHPEAARIALQMWRHGPALYRRSFVASAQQVARWSRVWRCGSEAAPDRACQPALQIP